MEEMNVVFVVHVGLNVAIFRSVYQVHIFLSPSHV